MQTLDLNNSYELEDHGSDHVNEIREHHNNVESSRSISLLLNQHRKIKQLQSADDTALFTVRQGSSALLEN